MSQLAPTVKQTGQESGCELCEIFKFCFFLQLNSVNNVCKLFQLLGDFVPQTPGPTGYCGLLPQTVWDVADSNENFWVATESMAD